MNANTPKDVITLALSEKERMHSSRNRKGCHVFLSRYFLDYKNLSPDEKIDLLYENTDGPENPYDDVNSVDTPPQERITCGQICRKAWAHYRGLESAVRDSWDKRATRLNKLLVPGKIVKIPEEIEKSEIETLLKECITDEWKRSSKTLHSALQRDPPAGQAAFTRYFGKERVTLGTQTFRTIFLSPLVRCVLFGTDFVKVKNNIISRSKNVVLLHFHTNQRVKEIFTVAGLCGVEVVKNDRVSTCCGKVILGYRRNRSEEVAGFVTRMQRRRWEVKLEGSNELVTIIAPKINKNNGQYDIRITDGNNTFQIVEYAPVRVKISMLGEMKITMNRVTYDAQKDIIPQLTN